MLYKLITDKYSHTSNQLSNSIDINKGDIVIKLEEVKCTSGDCLSSLDKCTQKFYSFTHKQTLFMDLKQFKQYTQKL